MLAEGGEPSEGTDEWADALWKLICDEWVTFPYGDDLLIEWYKSLKETSGVQ